MVMIMMWVIVEGEDLELVDLGKIRPILAFYYVCFAIVLYKGWYNVFCRKLLDRMC